mgnify:FL=1|nr:MAG TPA: hypothetical protein [Caudoviricetes sp.]
MSNYTYADLFDKSASKKEITIETEDKSVKITNSEIHFEQFELKEILCDDDYLTFGQCNASQLKFKISNVFTSMVGKQINVSAVINGHTDAPFIFGKYRVISDKPTDDKRYRNVTAYDAIYDIGEAEVSSWYNGLKFPLTLKQFRDSFFAYFGVEQVETTLPNDSMEVAETIKPSELSGQTVMEAICSINGCFGHINHDGKFEYVFLKAIISGLYPKKGLYPQKGLYPRKGSEKEKVTGGKYKSVKYEDFVCQKVTKVQIRKSENDIGAVYPDTEITENDNSYILQDNFLVYGMGADDLETVARNLYEVIKVVKYRPYNCEKIGNPCLSLGEAVNVYTAKEIIESYVLSRTYKGIQQPTDTISASGKSPKYSEQVNGINKSIIQLRGKTNELERTVEETRSEIKDVESGLDTKITQTAGKIELESTRAQGVETDLAAAISVQADQIKLKVSKGDVSSQLSIESGQVSIYGDRFVLSATNCSISKEGKITAKDVDLSGKITASSGNIAGFTIESRKMYYSSSSLGTGSSGVYIGTDGISLGNKVVLKADGSANLKDATLEGDLKISGSLGTISFSSGGNSMLLDRKGISFAASSISTKITSSEISVGSSLNYSKATSEGIQIRGSGGFLDIYASATTWASSSGTYYLKDNYGNNLAYISTNHFSAVASNVLVGKSGGNVAFFGATSGSTKKTVSKIISPSSTSTYSIATTLNSLIDALKAYNLIG